MKNSQANDFEIYHMEINKASTAMYNFKKNL